MPMDRLKALFQDKNFTGKLTAIAVPIAVQNLINTGINALDTIMLGRIGEVQLSASSVSNQLSFMFMVLSMGVSAGCGVLTAQYWGAGDVKRVREIMSFMYRVVAVLTLIFSAIAIIFPQVVLGIITTDAEVIAEGIIYLRIMGIGYIFSGVTNASIGILRTTGTVKISVVVYASSLVINFIFNSILIFGLFGFPALGIAGAAIATVIARFCEVIIMAIYLFKFENKVRFRPSDLFYTAEGVAGQLVTHASPVLFNEMLWTAANFLIGVIIGRMGREFVAANSISGLMIQFAGIAVFGISNAAGAIVGNTIGSGDYKKAREYANGLIAVSVVVGIAACVAINIVRLPIIDFYKISETARGYARQLTAVVSVLVIFQSIALVSMMGTLRGGGDTRFVMFMDVVFAWAIAIPLGALAGLVLHWPVWIVYAILKSEDFFKTIIVLWRVPGGKWLRDVTR